MTYVNRYYVNRYYVNRYYVNRYYANRYYVNRYCVNRYYVNRYYVNRYSGKPSMLLCNAFLDQVVRLGTCFCSECPTAPTNGTPVLQQATPLFPL